MGRGVHPYWSGSRVGDRVNAESAARVDTGIMGLYAAKNAVVVAAELQLGNTASRLLLHMALECWDDADNPAGLPPRRYFGRRELSAFALGFMAPHNGSEAAFRAVKRAIKELIDKGAIIRIRHGGNGKPAEYELKVRSSRPRRGAADPIVLPQPHPQPDSQGTDFSPPQRASF